MKVIAFDPFIDAVNLEVEFFDGQALFFNVNTISKEEVLKQADFITLHVPAQKEYVISTKEFELMKDGAFVINAARGGVIDEVALVKALEEGQISKKGEIGELLVRGSGLAFGYYNDPEKTSQSFVQNPVHDSYPDLVYKTGDLVFENDSQMLKGESEDGKLRIVLT